MSVWRTVQETLYQRWRDHWVDDVVPTPGALTPYGFANEKLELDDQPWVQFRVVRMPGGNGTMGKPGNRKMDRVGAVIIDLRESPLNGVGRDRKSVVQGKSVSVRVDLGGRRLSKQKKHKTVTATL